MTMGFDEFHARHRRIPQGEENDPLTEAVIGAAIEVHRVLGPGYAESVYETALCHELELRGVRYERQAKVDLTYKGKPIGEGWIDLLVEGQLVVELKSCEGGLHPVHRAQCISYLVATGHRVALLINFNVPILKDGIKRIVRSA